MRIPLRVILLVVLPLAAVGGGLWVWLSGGRYISTENAYVKADIVQVSSEVAGRVRDVLVKDHAAVAAGSVLVVLDPEPFRIALAKTDAELDAARAQVQTLVASWSEAKSELKEAESKVAFWQAQLTRQMQLAGRGIIASTKLEEVENNAIAASDRALVMRDKMHRVATQLGGDPVRPIEQHPMVREKRAERDRAALDMSRATIVAPVDGTAVNVRLQPGEQIRAATALFSIVSATQPWVEANFKETELTHVRPGQTATVVLDIYPDVTWLARVESISPATGAEFALLPPQNASGNWIKVVQRLPVRLRLVAQSGEPPLRAGMTASVRVDTGRESRLARMIGGWTALATSLR